MINTFCYPNSQPKKLLCFHYCFVFKVFLDIDRHFGHVSSKFLVPLFVSFNLIIFLNSLFLNFCTVVLPEISLFFKVLGEVEEFEKAVRLVVQDVSFDNDVVVSVFETNIRVLG